MPEMARFCGRTYRVFRRVEKVYFDFHYYLGAVPPAVLLEDVRCDGTAHGGCRMGCLILWKEAWLQPAEPRPEPAFVTLSVVDVPTQRDGKYVCQATELRDLAAQLPGWKPGQYLRDLFNGNRRVAEVLGTLVLQAWNRVRRCLGLVPQGTIRGPNRTTPVTELNLQPGQWVRVKSREDIEATLDYQGRNRGMAFAPDMIRYCGGIYRVAHRVERSIVEWSGELRPMNHTVALENVTCSGLHQQGCPRACYHLWREIWLEPAAGSEGDNG